MNLEHFKELAKDLEDEYIPQDINSYDKIKCQLLNGKRIYWYFELDKNYFEEEGENVLNFLNDLYSGICIPRPGVYNSGGEIDVDDVVVVCDRCPTEKDYPEVAYVALKKILDFPDLVEIVDKK